MLCRVTSECVDLRTGTRLSPGMEIEFDGLSAEQLRAAGCVEHLPVDASQSEIVQETAAETGVSGKRRRK